ncbi:MAG: S8 family serine peptidase [Planctomycetes bacterium]|nr:S8 family serine peptidase [Planctomycetota bacterium]
MALAWLVAGLSVFPAAHADPPAAGDSALTLAQSVADLQSGGPTTFVSAPAGPARIIVRFKPEAPPEVRTEAHAAAQATVVRQLGRAAAGRTAGRRSSDPGRHRFPVTFVPDFELVQVDGPPQPALAAYAARGEVLYAEPDYVWRLPEDADGNGVSQCGTHGSGVGPVREGAGGGGAQSGSQTRQEAGARGSASGGVVPDDPDFALQWGLRNTGQTINGDVGVPGADLRAGGAWALWTGDPAFRVAVIDTGIDYGHPDLASNLWTNDQEIPGNGLDDDGNGWIDDVYGYDFANDDGDPRDDHGHGSHVAGIIGAAGNNGVGGAGLNWRCRLVALKIFNSNGDAFTSDAIEAIAYAVSMGISVSNNSWGGDNYSQALRDAIAAAQFAGHLFVTAAGNSLGRNIDDFPVYPASYDLPNMLTVAATANDDQLSFVSNIGARSVDVGAPGHHIYSTVTGGGYDYLTGTSMATGYATAVVALLRGRRPDLGWSQVKDRLLATTRPLASLQGRTLTGGILDAAAAVGDCNGNALADELDIAQGASHDCDGSGIPDECEVDCNGNGLADSCDIAAGGGSADCNGNFVPDECDVGAGAADCNHNGVPDDCDLTSGVSSDVNGSGVPDECELCDSAADCDDGNFCTDESCVGSLCHWQNRAGPCDDGDDCTGADRCVQGACQGDKLPTLECAPLFSMRVAAVGGRPLPGGPAAQVTAARGDRITLELYLERWDPVSVQAYNVVVDHHSYVSGATGALTPVVEPDPDAGAFIDKQRDDFIFGARPNITLLWNTEQEFYQYGGLVLFPEDCAMDDGRRAYLGTLLVDASQTASGTFSFCLNPDTENASFLLGCPLPFQLRQFNFGCATISIPLGDCNHGPDCNGNGIWDVCDINLGYSPDCNRNDRPDECDFADGASVDCNGNSMPDECDIASGSSRDCDANAVPDECEPDCNGNAVVDACDLLFHTSQDCNGNTVPDECDIATGNSNDCGALGNHIPDECEPDCNINGSADSCDLVMGVSADTDANGVPDECQNVRHVPADYATVQEAIDAASPGDTVLLADGVYSGEGNVLLDFGGKVLTLRGAGGAEQCTIDLGEFRHGVLFRSGENAASSVQGITFLNGAVGLQFEDGSTPRIEDCRFVGQRSAGLLAYSSPVQVRRCTIRDVRRGRSVFCWTGSDMVLSSCLIAENRGGGVYVYESSPVFENCLFARNGARVGAAVYVFSGNPTFRNCTIADQSAVSGAVFATRSELILENSIAWGSLLESGPQIILVRGSFARLDFSVVEGGEAGIYHDGNSVLQWGYGNHGVDPRFETGADLGAPDLFLKGAFRLRPDSPCINTGDPGFHGRIEETDVLGGARVVFESIDIGADEAEEFADCNGNVNPDGQDVRAGYSADCNGTLRPDECEVGEGSSRDCNRNAVPDECEALGGAGDCNGNSVPDACESDRDGDGVIDECDACPDDRFKAQPGRCGCGHSERDSDADRVPDCVDACPGADDARDCDADGLPDACEIAGGGAADANGNLLPDDCEAPRVAARGGRYIEVRPFDSGVPLALLLTGDQADPAVACVERFVQLDGQLGAQPAFGTASEWGIPVVSGPEIRPGTTYVASAGFARQGGMAFTAGAEVTTARWGDVDGDARVTMTDVFLVVQAFGGASYRAPSFATDLVPCTPNAMVSFADVQAALRAFQGIPFDESDCPGVCP